MGHFSHGNINSLTFFQPQNKNLEFVLQLAKSYGTPLCETSLVVSVDMCIMSLKWIDECQYLVSIITRIS